MIPEISSYINNLDDSRKAALSKLFQTVEENLPKGFEMAFGYGMPSFVVPHSIYPAGYHVDPKLPLGFISIASQKNFIALYHMGLYGSPTLLKWFQEEYPKHARTKLDMGKSCIRFKKIEDIPYDLIADLCRKVSVKQYVETYEKALNR
jgi:uncharacterized protein YdhG (YjbR/CyaY superfamily)